MPRGYRISRPRWHGASCEPDASWRRASCSPALARRVETSEDALLRTRVNYWLAEALLAIGAPGEAEPHLRVALELARERGYLHFMRTQAREEPAPLVFALGRGIEPDLVSSALVEAGPGVESALLQMATEETRVG